ncbi:hypothetical protein [Streptomyces sp. NRRL WC-3618]|uniref:hypothetical protein n=1 Tax=Streptomyces sp. NRRL WC-3618 TaxID=1519490 RepID=UPI00131AD6AA|nr:hypothetical protein [Streptomyces sp. NRRL WC-3618]
MKKLVVKSRRAFAVGFVASTLALGIGVAAPGVASAQPAPVSGSAQHTQNPPSNMDLGIDFWENMGWPNWRNLGDREWIEAAHWTQGLINFMNSPAAPSSSHGYTGTFQEYNTTIYDRQRDDVVPRRDANRIVRAIGTGDLFWTDDHYSTFHYAGRS